MDTNVNVVGLTQLGIEPGPADSEADTLNTRSTGPSFSLHVIDILNYNPLHLFLD